MENAPTVEEVKQAVDLSWKTAGLNSVKPPQILETIVFFTEEEEFECHAIVDFHGGNYFQVGNWKVNTISERMPSARGMRDCLIGDCISHEEASLLLVRRNGGPLPTVKDCRRALKLCDQIREHSQSHLSEQRELAHLLTKHKEGLEQDLRHCRKFPDLRNAAELLESLLAETAQFDTQLAALRNDHDKREIVSLEDNVGAEIAAMRSFREEIERSYNEQSRTLQTLRNRMEKLEAAQLADPDFQTDERERVERSYTDALKKPLSMEHSEAAAELRDILRLSEFSTADTFILRRRLYTLRLRCRKSMEPIAARDQWRGLAREVEQAIEKMKSR